VKLIAENSYRLVLLLLAISTMISLFSENETLKYTITIVTFVLVVVILIAIRRVNKAK
jgi:hypothetical protein